jgi:hypothetical protein
MTARAEWPISEGRAVAGREDEDDRHQDSEHHITNREDPRWEIVKDEPVDPIANEIVRVAGLATDGAQSALEGCQRTGGSHQRLGAYERDRSKMCDTKPESARIPSASRFRWQSAQILS